MADLALIYGLRLLPAEELEGVEDAIVKLKDGKTARVSMHLLHGDQSSIQKQLAQSIEAFFDIYPEI
jgi:hypothetical protein